MKIKELGIWGGIIAVLIAGCWFLISMVNSSPSPSAPAQITNLPPVSKDDFVKGASESAKVTLIEYGDFECPACASYHPIVKQLTNEFPIDLRIVYRFFPLTTIHKKAMTSAQAAYAAGQQDKFWEMHDKLYENQNSWTASSNHEDIFLGYAKDMGLDLPKFKEDATSSTTKSFIEEAAKNAMPIGVNSTPTFIVNGTRIQNPAGYEAFKKVIQDEINKK